jgi:RNA polymerase sigma-70 factor (ECF subfamily)
MQPPDADLMRRWQDGDADAFEALVRRWQGRIAALLGRLAGPHAAADLCQDVFLRIYQAGPRYREEGAFTTWLYRIVLNTARDAGRRARRNPQQLVDHEPPGDQAPEEDVCRRETAQLVTDAVAELPDTLRDVLILRHYEGMAFEDIARLTGTPASTLKSRFTAALARLRQRLEQRGLAPEEKHE